MKLNNSLTTLLISLLSFPISVLAQNSDPYTFPIRPNKTNFLSGTMGELRSSHFHAGIDIKTGGMIGEAVHATKRGYITRIKVSTSGYGNALYMLHPDGNTSVYAHLNEFATEIQSYVKSEQYKQQTFEIELFPEPYQFAFKSQEVIGISGNTGGSLGPHLHFEIRDKQQRVLNPLHYGFDEIKDNIPPIVQGFAIRPMTISSRISNQFERKEIPLKRNGFNYKAEDTISAIGEIGLELWGHDKLNGSANKNGISIIEVFVNGERHFKQDIDVMSFSLQRHILVHYPYDVKQTKGGTFHKLYVDDGNKLKFYDTKSENGALTIEQGKVYDINIYMYDPYQNKSNLSLTIIGEDQDLFLNENIPYDIDGLDYRIENEVLKVFTQSSCEGEKEELNLNFEGRIESILPAYYSKNTVVYLWHLKNGIPKSILNCEKGMNLPEITEIIPGESKEVELNNMKISFSSYSLFDSLYLQTLYEIKTSDSLEIFSLEPTSVPLKSTIEIELTPQKVYADQKHTHIYKTDDSGNFSFEGGEWNNGKIDFNTRELADYTLLTDSISPFIEAKNNLNFVINDELSGIKSFEARLDGEWVLLKYEPKDNLIWVDWLNKEMKRSGEFSLIVTDNAGNKAEYLTKL
ncbi:M23 family metallopeptidase [uncultured Marivirga sp.]|uniref:M23 family metallopeptidase n=1 Tax=uncultured Marivirga sp. TaxID=1123707 RepID=UPI0030EB56D3